MISISHLTKNFGDLVAVDDLSLTINQGEILGLLGPNGAGKTTTIRMLCALLESDAGEIHWETPMDLSELIGFCSQENLYWPRLTCLEQLVFLGKMHKMSTEDVQVRALELLNILGLSGKADVYASKLSGGMQRRLNIALALIHDPPVLILDELEAGLDPQSRILVRDLIRSLAKQKTVIITTHNMDEAERLSDRVAIIDHGKLLEVGSIDSLKEILGTGDCLECRLETDLEFLLLEKSDHATQFIADVSKALGLPSESISVVQHKLIIRSFQHLEKLSILTDLAKKHGLEIRDIQLRKTTLEDVFIHLTGRALRE
ncbi:MAG: ABC transporter ATP-binding protein [Candidatus Marinimicrobia bacterium]|nr:ABC transporter ATP-binding protein [Candidatus Neomarinimicrobiota bacterium]